ncbi:hypothetical protein LshimejAT787_1000510 [Lyophyllum shimeji]|uniref:Uncharacterized protein n=1 Tax=Lyophyllum shimeji TaxID=47721 RepID=A0A9P3PTK3_LYOSH|nr:hypothetical protein LshimejAT787_1000510 [Lyophyllum shimeji]
MLFTTIIQITVALATFASSASALSSELERFDQREFHQGFSYGRQLGHLAKRECGQGFGGKSTGKWTDPGCTVEKQRHVCMDNCNFLGKAGGMRGGGGADAGCHLACMTMKFKSHS